MRTLLRNDITHTLCKATACPMWHTSSFPLSVRTVPVTGPALGYHYSESRCALSTSSELSARTKMGTLSIPVAM